MKNKHKGNRKEQVRRRRQRMKGRPPKQSEKYQLIDGNWSFYPVGRCTRYGGYLTTGLMETHNCLERDCVRFRKMGDEDA